jgi:hypothetical protein
VHIHPTHRINTPLKAIKASNKFTLSHQLSITAMATEKVDTVSAEKNEFAIAVSETVSAADIQARFSELENLDETQMATLNKKLLKRIDWRLMPMITVSRERESTVYEGATNSYHLDHVPYELPRSHQRLER